MKKPPGRNPDGTQSDLLSAASSRIWHGSKVSAAPDPPGGRFEGYLRSWGMSTIHKLSLDWWYIKNV